MSYITTANRPSPVAAMGALGVPAAFGTLLVFGLAIAGVIKEEDERLVGYEFKEEIPKVEPIPEPDPKPEAQSTTQTQQFPKLLTPPARPETPFVFNAQADRPITELPGLDGNLISGVETVDFGIPTSPAPRFDPIAAAPRGNTGRWITDSDYRSSWINREYSGIAGFRLEINARGGVTNCSITRSTGHAVLDQATCRLIQSRAEFSPAKDSSGNNVAGTFRSSVNWKIPE